MVRKLKVNTFQIRVIINVLNAMRLKQKANGMDCSETSALILRFIDVLEA